MSSSHVQLYTDRCVLYYRALRINRTGEKKQKQHRQNKLTYANSVDEIVCAGNFTARESSSKRKLLFHYYFIYIYIYIYLEVEVEFTPTLLKIPGWPFHDVAASWPMCARFNLRSLLTKMHTRIFEINRCELLMTYLPKFEPGLGNLGAAPLNWHTY